MKLNEKCQQVEACLLPKIKFQNENNTFLLYSTCILDLDTSCSCHDLEIPQVSKMVKNWIGKPFSQVWAMSSSGDMLI